MHRPGHVHEPAFVAASVPVYAYDAAQVKSMGELETSAFAGLTLLAIVPSIAGPSSLTPTPPLADSSSADFTRRVRERDHVRVAQQHLSCS